MYAISGARKQGGGISCILSKEYGGCAIVELGCEGYLKQDVRLGMLGSGEQPCER